MSPGLQLHITAIEHCRGMFKHLYIDLMNHAEVLQRDRVVALAVRKHVEDR